MVVDSLWLRAFAGVGTQKLPRRVTGELIIIDLFDQQLTMAV